MITFSRSLAVAVTALLVGLVQPAGAQQPPAGNAANGQRLYLADGCYQCHGTVGQGGRYNGPAPRVARPQLGFEGFLAQLREPSNDMPPYVDGVLSDKDVADIYAYLAALPAPQAVRDIPLLNQ